MAPRVAGNKAKTRVSGPVSAQSNKVEQKVRRMPLAVDVISWQESEDARLGRKDLWPYKEIKP